MKTPKTRNNQNKSKYTLAETGLLFYICIRQKGNKLTLTDMKTLTITLKESSLRTVVKNNSFNAEGLYQFVAIKFDTKKGGVAKPYHSVQVSQNNFTNYPGVKVWDANSVKMSKARVLAQLIERAKDAIESELYSVNLYSEEFDGIHYKLNYVEN